MGRRRRRGVFEGDVAKSHGRHCWYSDGTAHWLRLSACWRRHRLLVLHPLVQRSVSTSVSVIGTFWYRYLLLWQRRLALKYASNRREGGKRTFQMDRSKFVASLSSLVRRWDLNTDQNTDKAWKIILLQLWSSSNTTTDIRTLDGWSV